MKRSRIIDADFFYGATPEIFFRAGQLRKNMTKAERKLWEKLRKKQIAGLTFRRQHPINNFIADFYCHKLKLVIEVDGSIHEIEDIKLHDKGRGDEFEKYGITTLRFKNEEIIENLNGVIEKIKCFCENKISNL